LKRKSCHKKEIKEMERGTVPGTAGGMRESLTVYTVPMKKREGNANKILGTGGKFQQQQERGLKLKYSGVSTNREYFRINYSAC